MPILSVEKGNKGLRRIGCRINVNLDIMEGELVRLIGQRCW